jgi:glycosyltransferase involved in cell wall biosynthesis
MHICYIQRHPATSYFSIERICLTLANQIGKKAEVSFCTLPFNSTVFGAPCNLAFLPKWDDTIYHIIGDVHYAALALPRERTVITYHDAVLLHRLTGLKRHILLEYSYREPIRRAAAITTISRFSLGELERECGGLPRPVSVIHNPVDPIFLRAERKLNGGRPKILQVGSNPHKNVDMVIRALAGMDCELQVVGQPRKELEELAFRERVALLWHTGVSNSELVSLYERAALVTFASSYEGFGLPIIEAQAVGCPVITSTCCSLPEVAGDGALLVKPGNVEDLRLAVKKLLDDPELCVQLTERGKQNVLRFTPAQIADEYMAIYESVLDAKERLCA